MYRGRLGEGRRVAARSRFGRVKAYRE